MSRPWVLTAFLLGCAACVSIPVGVRSTFADAEPHENDYLRARSDAPSPRGFLEQPKDAGVDAATATDDGGAP